MRRIRDPRPPTGPDRTLLERVASGDSGAVAECVDRYGPLVWSIARRLLGDGHEIEDAVQEVFVDLWRSACRFDPSKASEATFVAMVARRRVIDRVRRRGQDEPTDPTILSEILQADAVWASAEDCVSMDQELRRLRAAVASLGRDQRNVLRLAIHYGYSHSQIAALLEMPVGTVKTHVRRGLMALKGVYGQASGGDHGQ